jgi:hypothetical protein
VENVQELDKLQRIPLKENGDFRSSECIELLKESDIISTNPPFSLFREYVAQLIEFKKKFLIIGNAASYICKEIFPLIKNNEMWWGVSPRNMKFLRPDNTEKQINAVWYTNLPHKKRNEELILFRKYKGNEKNYPKYDNYEAIHVSKTIDIPKDYHGVMCVPITFLSKFNPDQFVILGFTNTGEDNPGIRYKNTKHGRALLNGNELYTRLLIKRKEN